METARHPRSTRRTAAKRKSDSVFFADAAYKMEHGKKPRSREELAEYMVDAMATIDAQRSASKVMATRFGIDSFGCAPPIDAVLMNTLRTALFSIDEVLVDACRQRGLLSTRLMGALNMLIFLAPMLPKARAAQDVTEVPASILLAEAFVACGGATEVAHHDLFKLGRPFNSYMDSFLDRAYALKADPSFAPVLRVCVVPSGQHGFVPRVDDAKYIEEVTRWSDAAHKGDATVSETLKTYGLAECDRIYLR
jgi:hypothetical protein